MLLILNRKKRTKKNNAHDDINKEMVTNSLRMPITLTGWFTGWLIAHIGISNA